MPKFSIILPLYNKAAYVEATLKSILSQTEQDYELIVVNDASTDASRAVVERMGIANLIWIEHPTNRGLAATRNTGISAATGEYLTFLDADDVWEPFFLDEITRLQTDFPEARLFATNYWEWFGTQRVTPHNAGRQLDSKYRGLLPFFEYNIGQGIYNHGSVCFHRSVFETVGRYNENLDFSEDIDFNIRANYHFALAYSNRACMYYRMAVEGQMTSGRLKQQRVPDFTAYIPWEKTNTALKKYLDFERYVLVKKLKQANRSTEAQNIVAAIDKHNLNYKQRWLLQAPVFLLHGIQTIKQIAIRLGIKLSSY